ncbi:MAG: glycosyltransferase family 4 protein [Thermoplasmatales archaeon]|nr:glycosyltransferase family 4 protein [Thermoplasmatales archaeon]
MKILWLAHRDPLNPRAGGAERSISEVCSRLSIKGYEVSVLSAGWNRCKSYEFFRGYKIRRFGNSLSLHLYVPLYLLKYTPDIVVNDLGHAIPWPSSTFLRKQGIIFFRHLHARSLPGQVNRLLALFITAVEKGYFLLYHNYKFITESSTSVADLKGIGIRSSNIIKIPPGVDTAIYMRSPKTEYPSLVYFGGFRKYKRPGEAVWIFEQIHKIVSKAKLIVIGSGPELNHVKELVESNGLSNSVAFTGRIPDKELVPIISSSWVNLHTSRTEGWGLSIIEASAAGTPTVAYSVPGVVDTIEDGINGFKVDDNNRNAFVDTVLKILENPKPLWESSRTVAEKYSWEDTARLWDKAIREVLEKK